MSQIFLYAEVQASVPFTSVPWQNMNPAMKNEPGLIRKTWLSGLETSSVGGIYEFDTVDNARRYVDHYLVNEARRVGGAGSLMTRLYDARVTEDASRDMRSPWLVPRAAPPSAKRIFVFNDMHWNKPFHEVPWRELNVQLKQQRGLLTKQWLSGIATHSVAGFYEFDTKENALDFLYGMFARECRHAGVTSNAKLFDGDIVARASADMASPYFSTATSVRVAA